LVWRSCYSVVPGLGREGFSFYFPLTTSIIVSLAASLIIWLLRR